ncbi:MAG TPA: hypothetical protein VGN52_19765 [Burkholderiales bacterium]
MKQEHRGAPLPPPGRGGAARTSTRALLLVMALAASPLLLFVLGNALSALLHCRSLGLEMPLRCGTSAGKTWLVDGLLDCGFLTILSLPAGFVAMLVMSSRAGRQRQAAAEAAQAESRAGNAGDAPER